MSLFLGVLGTVSTGIQDLVGPGGSGMFRTKSISETLFVGVTCIYLGILRTVATGILEFVGPY
jgi:hypothetical protein